MTTKKRLAVLLATEEGPAALAKLGYVKAEEAAPTIRNKAFAEGREEGLKEGRQVLAEIAHLAELAQLDRKGVTTLIRQNHDVSGALAAIQTMQAEKPRKLVVLSDANQNIDGRVHSLITVAEGMKQDV